MKIESRACNPHRKSVAPFARTTLRSSVPKQAFAIAPLHVQSSEWLGERRVRYDMLNQTWKTIFALPVKPSIRSSFAEVRLLRETAHGPIFDRRRIRAVLDQGMSGEINNLIEILLECFNTINPYTTTKSYEDVLDIAVQLKGLGHPVHVLDIDDKADDRRKRFIQMALARGIHKFRLPGQPDMGGVISDINFRATLFARDQWVKIDDKREHRRFPTDGTPPNSVDEIFGEGGSMIPLGGKDWIIQKEVEKDARVAAYRALGFRFFPVSPNFVYRITLSKFFGFPSYAIADHIDFGFGSVPDLRLLIVNPHYYRNHRVTVDAIAEEAGIRRILVPNQESNRHPENCLPLGEGRVLVDRGAPELIEELRAAGVEPIPTCVPMDHIFENNVAGLHCLFNEL